MLSFMNDFVLLQVVREKRHNQIIRRQSCQLSDTVIKNKFQEVIKSCWFLIEITFTLFYYDLIWLQK